MVLVKREPNSGTPSTSGYDMLVTLPVWISAAAALVTAGVTRLVAPVWSFGPNGEALTTDLQSLCANATGLADKAANERTDISAARSMLELLRCGSDSWPRPEVHERLKCRGGGPNGASACPRRVCLLYTSDAADER